MTVNESSSSASSSSSKLASTSSLPKSRPPPSSSSSRPVHVPAQRGGAAAQRKKPSSSASTPSSSTVKSDEAALTEPVPVTPTSAAAHKETSHEASPTLRHTQSSHTLLVAQRQALEATLHAGRTGSTRTVSAGPAAAVRRSMESTSGNKTLDGLMRNSSDATAVGTLDASQEVKAALQDQVLHAEEAASGTKLPSEQSTASAPPGLAVYSTSLAPTQTSHVSLAATSSHRASSIRSTGSRTGATPQRIQFSPAVRIANAAPPPARQRKPPAGTLGGAIALAGGWGLPPAQQSRQSNTLAEVRAKEEAERKARKEEEKQEALRRGMGGRGGAGNRRATSDAVTSETRSLRRPKTAPSGAGSERKRGLGSLARGLWRTPSVAVQEEQRAAAAAKAEAERQEQEEEDANRDVFAPIHPNGPFGAPLPDGAHEGPALDATVVQSLPPPPRAFYPGTLILVRSCSNEGNDEDAQSDAAAEEETAIEAEQSEVVEATADLAERTSSPIPSDVDDETEVSELPTSPATMNTSLASSTASTLPPQTSPGIASSTASSSVLRSLPTLNSGQVMDRYADEEQPERVLWAGPPHEPILEAELAESFRERQTRVARAWRRVSRILVARRPTGETPALQRNEEDSEEESKSGKRAKANKKGHARPATLADPQSLPAQQQHELPPSAWRLRRRTPSKRSGRPSTAQPGLASLQTPEVKPSARIVSSRDEAHVLPILSHAHVLPSLGSLSPSPRKRPGTADAVLQRQPFIAAQPAALDAAIIDVLRKRETPWDLEFSTLQAMRRGSKSTSRRSSVAPAATALQEETTAVGVAL